MEEKQDNITQQLDNVLNLMSKSKDMPLKETAKIIKGFLKEDNKKMEGKQRLQLESAVEMPYENFPYPETKWRKALIMEKKDSYLKLGYGIGCKELKKYICLKLVFVNGKKGYLKTTDGRKEESIYEFKLNKKSITRFQTLKEKTKE